MTDEQQPVPGGELPEPAMVRPRINVALIWLVPALAALVALSLVVSDWLQAGPTIVISFLSAEGLVAGKTPVKYKSVVIGKVGNIVLSADRNHVLVQVALEKSAEGFATADARYWVVRPRIGLGGVSGVSTLLSGAYIGADVGRSKQSRDRFTGLEAPPGVLHDALGRSFTLKSDDLGSLDIGSPVYYRRIQVGQVVSYRLDADGKGVSLQIFVDRPNDKFVGADSRFWNASGVNVSLGADGLKVNSESLATVLAGGVAFMDPPGPHDGAPAPENASFRLFADQASALMPPDGPPRRVRMRFDQSLRGLTLNAPVEFLGINIGKVASMNLDYDPKRQRFALDVGAVVYPERLGRAYRKLASVSHAASAPAARFPVIGVLVAHGLRAQARIGNLLTGQLYIALDFPPDAPPASFDPKANPPEIPTMPGSFDRLQQQLADIVNKVHKLPLESIGRHLDQSLAELDRTLNQVNDQLLPQVHDSVLPEIRRTLEGAQRTLSNADRTLGNADRALGSADRALSADSPLQQNLDRTLEQLQRAARSLRALTDYLGAHPEALIRGRQPDPAPPAGGQP
ncbi:MAG: intermembrane transport protein PqiB [Burkholderiales bacterium]